nr:CerR family C-terminal domain-containing protein [Desulforamulus aquiferis]
MGSLNRGRFGSKVLPQFLELTQANLGEIIHEGIEKGVFRADLDIRQVLLSIHSLCLVYFTRRELVQHMWSRDMMSEDMLESRLQHVIDFVFNGILTHREDCVNDSN